MKIKFNYLLLLPVASCLAFASCDNIDINDRYIPVEKPVLPPHSVAKTLLIQEFTGNRCVNCPQGAAAIHQIQEEYPGMVIAVGMHPEGGGPNTQPIRGQDFRCEEAQVMYDFYKPDGFPCAVFNGTTSSTAYTSWYSEATAMLSQEANMTIDAACQYDESSRGLTVNYSIGFTNDIDTQMSVMVWIMENNIIGFQTDGGTILSDYVHNHVLRASLNGDWGQQLPSPQANGNVVEGSASITLDESWVADNCQVVVYVFQTQSRAVEQAALADVIGSAEGEGGQDSPQE